MANEPDVNGDGLTEEIVGIGMIVTAALPLAPVQARLRLGV
jgi:hypothetical protein